MQWQLPRSKSFRFLTLRAPDANLPEDDLKLPAGQLDAVLVVNAYHEFHEYAAVREALKLSGCPAFDS
jgi:hypothetical protein